MATGVRDVKIVFKGDTSSLSRASQQATKSMGRWKASTIALGTAAGAALVSLTRFAIGFGRESVAAFTEAEQAQLKLEDAFKRFPNLAGTNIDRLRQLNTELAKKVSFDDDAFASGQAVLAQFKLTGKRIEEITPLLADYAAKTGRSLPTAAKVLGRAFLGNTRALKELGINYKSTGNQAKDTENIIKLLQDKVGGFAEKQGKTAAGQAAILSNQFGELKEQVGQNLLPVLLKLADTGLKVIGFIQKNKEIIGPLVAVIAAVVAVQWAWNVAMTANPIGLIIVGIAALIAAIVFVATKTRFFQTVWNAAWGGIKAAALAVGRWFRDVLWNQWILGSLLAMRKWLIRAMVWWNDLRTSIVNRLKGLGEAILAPFKWAFNRIAVLWNNTVGRIRIAIPDWVPGLGGKTFAVPQIPTFHDGGIVPGRGDVLARVRGGEGVFTREQMAAMTGTVIVENHIEIGGEVVKVVRSELNWHNRDLRRRVLAGVGAR